MPKEFVHLHAHTEYSLLDGANQVDVVAKTAKKGGQRALAITDHGNMFGALAHYNACMDAGIKPIIGCEVYIAQTSRRLRYSRDRNTYNHLTLLAWNSEGYRNLLYLTSLSFIEGYSTRPRIDYDILSKKSAGIICLSGCLSGRINRLLVEEHYKEAIAEAAKLRDLFGPDNFWVEIQRNGIAIQDKANEGLIKISAELGAPLIATNDIHYHRKEDCDFQDTILCVSTGAKKAQTDRFRFDTTDVYFKSSEEMAHMFRDVPKSVRNTLDVADKIDVQIEQGVFKFPKLEGLEHSPTETLRDLVEVGLKNRYGTEYIGSIEILPTDVRMRSTMELDVINRMGYPEYFLVVKEMVDYAKAQGIPVGPGRGSAAGSIVSYALGITDVDPLAYNLIFERFLNEDRVGLPDIDVDFCKERREEVIDHLRDKYGDDRVAHIITFGRFGARSALRQVGRVLDIPLPDCDAMSKRLDPEVTIMEAVKADPKVAEDQKKYPELFRSAAMLEGFVSHRGMHASGVIIGDRPLYELVPLARSDKGALITQWDGDDCERIGLIKFDNLGLSTLTVIERCQKLIEARHGSRVVLETLELKNKNVLDVFARGDTEGVFQCYSDGMRAMLREMQIDHFNDIVAALALYRPGPMESGILKTYIRRKTGKEKVEYDHPDLEQYLSNTYGTMVFQEQIMQTARVLAGFTMKEADGLRKAVGKKKMSLLNPIKAEWLKGCKNTKKISQEKADALWNDILKFGRYGFNVAHAVSYAVISFRTAYLKHYYPVEYLASCLTQEANEGNTDRVKSFVHDCRLHGIKITPPDMRDCSWDFVPVDNNTIAMGIGGIKGIGRRSVAKMADKGLPDTQNIVTLFSGFTSKVIRKNVLESLIRSGALDFLGHNRGSLFTRAAYISVKLSAVRNNPKKKHPNIIFRPEDAWTEAELLFGERQVYGFYLSGHPMAKHKLAVVGVGGTPIKMAARYTKPVNKFTIVGVIAQLDVKVVKSGMNKGKKFARMVVEDTNAQVVTMVFTKMYAKYAAQLTQYYETAVPIIVRGKLDVGNREPQVVVMHLEEFKGRLSGKKELVIPVHFDGNSDTWRDLQVILGNNPGDTSISFQVMGDNGSSVIVRSSNTVDLNDEVAGALEQVIM